ncbi:adenylyl-sulfate kinase [Zunongwangia sp.]|uniref:adenylyl-sulfate kinase n=1 Tax=Zunongwangia sp. TaxID=1965325 RepID=UPI003AA80B6D
MGNIIPHYYDITNTDRAKLKNQRPKVIWFSGLSGSGKSTLANLLENKLFQDGFHTFVLDGDNIRMGLSQDLSFSLEDRKENLRRIAEVAQLFLKSGIIVLAAFITPKQKDRKLIKSILGESLINIFVDTPLEVCEKRDVKGLYKKARAGEIANFTGVSCTFETPTHPDLTIKTEEESIKESIGLIYNYIRPFIIEGE